MTIFFKGNTETVTVTYLNAGNPVDPDEAPTVTLYESDQVTVVGTPGTATQSAPGIWGYDQTLPTGIGSSQYIVEFIALFGGERWRIAETIVTAFVINTA